MTPSALLCLSNKYTKILLLRRWRSSGARKRNISRNSSMRSWSAKPSFGFRGLGVQSHMSKEFRVPELQNDIFFFWIMITLSHPNVSKGFLGGTSKVTLVPGFTHSHPKKTGRTRKSSGLGRNGSWSELCWGPTSSTSLGDLWVAPKLCQAPAKSASTAWWRETGLPSCGGCVWYPIAGIFGLRIILHTHD